MTTIQSELLPEKLTSSFRDITSAYHKWCKLSSSGEPLLGWLGTSFSDPNSTTMKNYVIYNTETNSFLHDYPHDGNTKWGPLDGAEKRDLAVARAARRLLGKKSNVILKLVQP